MSYLKHCDRVRQSSDEYWRIQWRSVRGSVTFSVQDKALYYKRYSKLGELLRRNSEHERKYIADAIEQRCGIRPTSFVGV